MATDDTRDHVVGAMQWTQVVSGDEADYFEGSDGNGLEDAYQSCVLRIRYNLSTSDFPAWPADAMPVQCGAHSGQLHSWQPSLRVAMLTSAP